MLITLKVALQVLTVAVAIFTSTLDYKWHDKRTKKFKTGRTLLFTLTGVLLFLSIGVTLVDDYESRKKEKTMTVDLQKLQEQNDGLQTGIKVLGEKSSDLLQKQQEGLVSLLDDQRKLNDETGGRINAASNILQSNIEQTVNQQKQTLGNLTGGDSFCYVLPMVMKNKVRFALYSKGEFPLYDILIFVDDLDTDEKVTYQAPTISTTLVQEFGDLSLESLNEKRLTVTLRTRYAVFEEDVRMVKVNDEWMTAYRVQKIAVVERDTISRVQEKPRLPLVTDSQPKPDNLAFASRAIEKIPITLQKRFESLFYLTPGVASDEPRYLLIVINYNFPRNKNGYVDW